MYIEMSGKDQDQMHHHHLHQQQPQQLHHPPQPPQQLHEPIPPLKVSAVQPTKKKKHNIIKQECNNKANSEGNITLALANE